MSEQEVVPIHTPILLPEYLAAIEAAWSSVESEPCTRGACSVLYGQYWIETGNKACYNWNIGNVKHVSGDGFDYHCLRNVCEGVPPSEAKRLVATGQATIDTEGLHPVGLGKIAVVFNPPHPQTRFRAYDSLADGMAVHLQFLKKKYAPAWQCVIAGDYLGFANALKKNGYFTADAAAYAQGMRPAFAKAMAYDANAVGIVLNTPSDIQMALNRLGYDAGPVDGDIGPRTVGALKRFQTDHGLKADGICGPITHEALTSALATV